MSALLLALPIIINGAKKLANSESPIIKFEYDAQKSVQNFRLESQKIQEADMEVNAVKVPTEEVVASPGEVEGMGGTSIVYDGDILDYIQAKFGDKYDEAVKIMMCESSSDRYAFNFEAYAKKMGWTEWSSCGLFQINSPLCEEENSILYDPYTNIDSAWDIYSQFGWGRWAICKAKNNL